MEWPVQQPVYLDAVRPARGRPRMNSEHPNHPIYVQDQQGRLLVPAAAGGYPMGRTMSNRERPASLVIHNNHWDERSSPGGHHHRRGSHGHDCFDDEWSDEEYHRSPRRRNRSRSHSHHHHYSPSRSPSPRYQDPVLAERLRKLEELEKAEEDKARKKAIEEKQKLEAIEKAEREKKERAEYEREQILAAEKKRQQAEDEKKRKEAWIEQWKLDEDAKKKKEEEKKKKEDEEFRERTIKTFIAAGYSEEGIEKMLKRAEKGEKKGHKEKGKHRHHDDDDDKQLMRPTYIKVHRKYMSTETLDEFDLPWEIDTNTEYIIIKKWINEHDQEELFRHTAKLREKKAQKKIEDTATLLKKDRSGKLMLVAEKGKGRSRSRSRGWIFT